MTALSLQLPDSLHNNTSDSFVTKQSKNSADLKPVSTPSTNLKKEKIFFLCNYLPHAHIYQKKQHIVKTSAATLNKSKKRKRFFLFF
jgi:hypothetical protein